MGNLISGFLRSEATWRFVDAYFPRVFGLFFHTALIERYGSAAYALPAWLLGLLGVFLAAIPDPHSYIIVRAHGPRARHLLALTVPWLVAKALIAGSVCWIGLIWFGSRDLLAHHEQPHIVILLALLFGAVEFAWSVLGTTSLAVGNVRTVAITGVVARSIAMLMILIGWTAGLSAMTWDLLFASLPTAVALCLLLPFGRHIGRSLRFMLFATKHYAGWSQGIGLVTVVLFQLPSIILGIVQVVPIAGIGQISYITRILQAVLQPLQILQSMVIRETVREAKGFGANLDWMRYAFRIGAIAIATIGAGLIWVLNWRSGMDAKVTMLSTCLVVGLSISAWHRYELSRMLATTRLKQLFMNGYLPVLIATGVLVLVLMPIIGAYGLGVAIVLGWIGISLCWKWNR